MTKNETAGIGDPYWYEWSIGLLKVMDMLNPDNQIESVTLQATKGQGLDDVVVSYENGDNIYYQVKHTRVGETITFGDFVGTDSKDMSLLKSLAKAWKEVKGEGQKSIPILYTNRKYGTKKSSLKTKTGDKFTRPLLQDFWSSLKHQIHKVQYFEELQFDSEWEEAWNEWCNQLTLLENDEEKLSFLRFLEIQVEQPNLQELESKLVEELSLVFGINIEKAKTILPSFYHALLEWSTTIRGQQESITIEAVYDKLSMSAEQTIGEHRLPTPEPFFPSRSNFVSDLSKELLNGSNKVVFLSGSPGIGKTSIVNYLANRHDPIIDLRYHAYHPITPSTTILPSDAGQMTNPEVLWGDLLSQLRILFKGRLAKCNVPIRNEFLTVDEMRQHVLRLADALGKERGKRTVIAIDGLDHAARAEENHRSFLDSLIPPDGVPETVCFFIVGQPSEDYKNYPFWLREKEDPAISRWNVKGIKQEDIKAMLDDINFPTLDIASAVRLIDHISSGNTLTAIFAVYEAENCEDINSLQQTLERRKLHIGISAYYDQIWKSSVLELEKNYPFIGYKIAACFTLGSERLQGVDLKEIFPEVTLLVEDWNDLLRSLRPLVIEEADGFRITHNDVRVHLTKQTRVEQNKFKKIASAMADYYWKDPEKSNARHHDLFRLLQISDRTSEKAKVFTTEYVIEGISVGRSKSQLIDQCKQALLVVSDTKDWELIHGISSAVATLLQFIRTMEMTDREYSFTTGIPPVLLSEGHVPNIVNWDLDTLKNTVDDSLRLISLNELNRAKGLLRRWFHDFTPVDLIRTLAIKDIYVKSGHQKHYKNGVKEFFSKWGRVTQYTGLLWEPKSLDKESVTDQEKFVIAAFFSGYIEEAVIVSGKYNWARSLKHSLTFFWDTIGSSLDKLIEEQRWEEIAYTLTKLKNNIEESPSSFQIKAAAYSLLTGKQDLYKEWTKPIKMEGYKLAKESESDLNEKNHMYCLISFTMGWLNPTLETGTIANKAINNYFENGVDNRQREHAIVLNNSSAILGNWYRQLLTKDGEALKSLISETQLIKMLDALLGKNRSPVNYIYGSNITTKVILKMIIHLTEKVGDPNNTLFNYIKEYCKRYPVNFMLEIGWRYLADRGKYDYLLDWFNYWNGPTGKVWNEEISSRLEISDEFIELAKEVGFHEEVENLTKRLKWGRIGYSTSKENVLEKPLKWFKELVQSNPRSWKEEGKTLLEISQKISDVGDNLVQGPVNEIIIKSAVFSGVRDTWDLYNATNIKSPLIENPIDLVSSITDFINEDKEFSDSELQGFWAFGTGLLSWENDRDHYYLKQLKNIIIKKGTESIASKLNNTSPAEYNLFTQELRHDDNLQEYKMEGERIIKIVNELPIDEAISKLLLEQERNESYSSSNIWRGVEAIARRIKIERPPNFEQKIDMLLSALENREVTYSWSYDGVANAYGEVIQLVRDAKRIEILDEMISNMDLKNNSRLWLESLGENIELICLYRAVSLGEEAIRKGIRRLIDTQKLWIEGNGFLPDLVEIDFPVEEIYIPTTWNEFAAYYFFDLIKTDNATRIQGALKGLWRIAQVDPSAIDFIARKFDELHPRAKEWMLLLAERAARSNPISYTPFQEFVYKCYISEDINLKFQAFNILIALKETTGQQIPKWEFKEYSASREIDSLIISAEKGILSIPSQYQGSVYSVIGIQTINSRLELLGAATRENLRDLEKKYAAFVKKDLSVRDYELNTVYKEAGTIKVILSPEMEMLKAIIYNEIFKGRWFDVPKVRLAQALTTSVDPFILLESPAPAPSVDNWLIDEELDGIISDKDKIKKYFNPIINAGIAVDEMVLGAILFSYSRKFDVRVVYDLKIKHSNQIFKVVPFLTTFNGRSFAFYDVNRYDPQKFQEEYFSMTYESGGVGDFVHQNILCYPSHYWTTIFGWYPKKDNPLIWCDDDGVPIVRLEYYHGPIRHLLRDRFERQPLMQRWVIKKEPFEKAIKELGNYVFRNESIVKIDKLP